MNKTNNLRAYLRDLYEGIVSKKPDASRNPQNFRSEIEAIRTGGEFYEVMDASELPLDAPDGSLALVEVEVVDDVPRAYTVSSVDELPSDAVDGSMAIVEQESEEETWVFKDELDNLGESYTAWYDAEASNSLSPFNIEYSNYNIGEAIGAPSKVWKAFSAGTQGSPSWGIYNLSATEPEMGINISLYTHNPSGNYGITHGWGDEAYKTIKVHFADEEATQWLKAHATSLGKAVNQKLYTRENGEWVYKCEVV